MSSTLYTLAFLGFFEYRIPPEMFLVPTFSPASRSTACFPRDESCFRAASPAEPPPTITTSYFSTPFHPMLGLPASASSAPPEIRGPRPPSCPSQRCHTRSLWLRLRRGLWRLQVPSPSFLRCAASRR